MTSFKREGSSAGTGNEYVIGGGIGRILERNFRFNPDGIPQELKDRAQWVVWAHLETSQTEEQKAQGVPPIAGKLPVYVKKIDRGHLVGRALWRDKNYLLTFDEALKRYNAHSSVIHGVGFVFSDDDPFTVIDIDKVTETDDERLLFIKGNTWCEVSQSGKGYHIVVKDVSVGTKVNAGTGVEIYSKGRFIAMTGNVSTSCPLHIVSDQQLVNDVVAYHTAHSKGGTLTGTKYEKKKVVPSGGRNNEMFAFIGSCVWKGYTREHTIVACRQYNDECFVPPLDEQEYLSMVHEQFKKASRVAQDAIDSILLRYVLIRDCNRWWDFMHKVCVVDDAINKEHQHMFKGTKGELPKLNKFLCDSPSLQTVTSLGWRPIPWGMEDDNSHKFYKIDGCEFVNTWKGWGCAPVAGDVSVWLELLTHLVPEDEYRRQLLMWLSYMVRHPDKKCQWQIVLLGVSGAGKDSLFKPLSAIFGSASKPIGNEDIKGSYDDGLIGTKLLHVSEVRGLRGDSIEKMKRFCASENTSLMMLNPKGMTKVYVENLWSVVIITNDYGALALDMNERRFYVLNSSKVMSESLQSRYYTWFMSGGSCALMHYLLYDVDISDFNPHQLPERTVHFYNMHDSTRNDMESILSDMNENKVGLFAHDLIFPDHAWSMLRMKDVMCPASKVMTWLKQNGWDSYNGSFKIMKKINGEVNCKSRHWLYRVGGVFDYNIHKVGSAEVWLECDRIDKFVTNSGKF